jgi:hypothetical protein
MPRCMGGGLGPNQKFAGNGGRIVWGGEGLGECFNILTFKSYLSLESQYIISFVLFVPRG